MKHWDHLRWGVMLITKHDAGKLLGESWHAEHAQADIKSVRSGQPARPLMWTTREAAREWAASENRKWMAYPPGHVCRSWKVRVVRVRERVEMVR